MYDIYIYMLILQNVHVYSAIGRLCLVLVTLIDKKSFNVLRQRKWDITGSFFPMKYEATITTEL